MATWVTWKLWHCDTVTLQIQKNRLQTALNKPRDMKDEDATVFSDPVTGYELDGWVCQFVQNSFCCKACLMRSFLSWLDFKIWASRSTLIFSVLLLFPAANILLGESFSEGQYFFVSCCCFWRGQAVSFFLCSASAAGRAKKSSFSFLFLSWYSSLSWRFFHFPTISSTWSKSKFKELSSSDLWEKNYRNDNLKKGRTAYFYTGSAITIEQTRFKSKSLSSSGSDLWEKKYRN